MADILTESNYAETVLSPLSPEFSFAKEAINEVLKGERINLIRKIPIQLERIGGEDGRAYELY